MILLLLLLFHMIWFNAVISELDPESKILGKLMQLKQINFGPEDQDKSFLYIWRRDYNWFYMHIQKKNANEKANDLQNNLPESPRNCFIGLFPIENPAQIGRGYVAITILDINDNAPEFAMEYETTVCENAQPGQVCLDRFYGFFTR